MTTASTLPPSYLSQGPALALRAGAAMLSGCGPTPAPASQTANTTEETTTRPLPPADIAPAGDIVHHHDPVSAALI
jgi:hypothetical protein